MLHLSFLPPLPISGPSPSNSYTIPGNCANSPPSNFQIPLTPRTLPTQDIPPAPPPGVIPSTPVGDFTQYDLPDSTNGNSSYNSTGVTSEFIKKWSSTFFADTNWREFSDHFYDFANDVITECDKISQHKKKTAPPRPSVRPVNNNRRPLQYNPIEAHRIQTLYCQSKKRAARQVISDNKPSYTGSVQDANEFFSQIFEEKWVDVDAVKNGLNNHVPSGPKDESLGDPIMPDKIAKKLRSLSNSPPGADRVEYRHLKSIDPKGEVLCSIYNWCLIENDVHSNSKTSRTLLIHKKRDAEDISNFRPIALMSCIYKLFMSVMANCLVNYSIDNNYLSSSQKSARPTEGCYEHTYIFIIHI